VVGASYASERNLRLLTRLPQNSVKNPAFAFKSKIAFPGTEVLGKPQVLGVFEWNDYINYGFV
jgi:hypothetical protein